MITDTRRGMELRCPFCDLELPRPVEMMLKFGEKVSAGICGCGAVYLLDETGKSVGEIMVHGLGMIAENLSMPITDLVPGKDYEDVVISYDWRTHRSAGVSTGYMDGYGRLYVIRSRRR